MLFHVGQSVADPAMVSPPKKYSRGNFSGNAIFAKEDHFNPEVSHWLNTLKNKGTQGVFLTDKACHVAQTKLTHSDDSVTNLKYAL